MFDKARRFSGRLQLALRSAPQAPRNMTDGSYATAQHPSAPPLDVGAGNASPGWYDDPWTPGHHRYWTGQTWSAVSFPSAQTATAPPPATSPPPDTTLPWRRRRMPSGRALFTILLVLGLLVGFGGALGITLAVGGGSSNSG